MLAIGYCTPHMAHVLTRYAVKKLVVLAMTTLTATRYSIAFISGLLLEIPRGHIVIVIC
jgi:hypothetical protein